MVIGGKVGFVGGGGLGRVGATGEPKRSFMPVKQSLPEISWTLPVVCMVLVKVVTAPPCNLLQGSQHPHWSFAGPLEKGG